MSTLPLGTEPLEPEQQLVLQLIYGAFSELGRWPIFEYLDRRLHREHGIDALRVMPTISSDLLLPRLWMSLASQRNTEIALTLAGVARCTGGETDVDLFLAALRWFAVREAAFEPQTVDSTEDVHVTAEKFTVHCGVEISRIALSKLGVLLYQAPMWIQAGDTGSDHWMFGLSRDIRRYANVQSLADYHARLHEQLHPNLPSVDQSIGVVVPVAVEVLDFFISHASEDKAAVARPLRDELVQRGFSVWFDEATLTLGDSLRQKIDEGLRTCRFGVVVLSHAFFAKNWPQYELDGLVERQMQGQKVVLPVWHDLTHDEVAQYSPTLAGYLSVETARGIAAVADAIEEAARRS